MVLPASDTSETSISSVAELIEMAYGFEEENSVNFRILHAILLVLARHLCLLQRKVKLELPFSSTISFISSMAVTEVKVRAKGGIKKKGLKYENSELSSVNLTSLMYGIETSGKALKDKSELPDKITLEKSTKSAYEKDKQEQKHKIDAHTKFSTRKFEKASSDISEYLDGSDEKTSSEKKHHKSDKGFEKDHSDTINVSTKSTSHKIGKRLEQKSTNEQSSQYLLLSSSNSTKRSSEGSYYSGEGLKKRTSRSSQKSSGKAYENIAPSMKGKSSSKRQSRISESTESSDIQQERILIVETIPTGETEPLSRKGSLDVQGRRYNNAPQSLVTIEQFEKLFVSVIQLQDRFGSINVPGFKNSALLKAMHRTTSLSDPMAVLQLSARLEVAEKAIEQMLTVLKKLANKTPGVIVPDTTQSSDLNDSKAAMEKNIIQIKPVKQKSLASKEKEITTRQDLDKEGASRKTFVSKTSEGFKSKTKADTISMASVPYSTQPFEALGGGAENVITDAKHKDLITNIELNNRLRELEEDLHKAITTPTSRAESSASSSIKLAKTLAITLEKHLNVNDQMASLEENISQYTDKVNYIDSEFSALITNYQEELTQMQYNLELSLDNMAEALANRETDADAVAELNNKFSVLQTDIDKTVHIQKELKELEKHLHTDLKSLWNQIEILKQVKSDRDEVEQALSTKAGILFLNGKVSVSQNEAVRGDLQKKVATSYEKFNNQEIIWQKHIDDVMRSLNDRAEAHQVETLRLDIIKKLKILREKLDFMLNVCGEPRVNDAKRAIMHDMPCLSCSMRAKGELDPKHVDPRTQPVYTKTDTNKDISQDHGNDDQLTTPCIPNKPIPHSLNIRAHTCQRYCGGVLDPDLESDCSEGISSIITVQTIEKQPTTKPKVPEVMRPCVPCNQRKMTILKKEAPKEFSHIVDADGLHNDLYYDVDNENNLNDMESANEVEDSRSESATELISDADDA